MRYFAPIFAVVVITSCAALGQTELWRLPGSFSTAFHGDNNSVYLAHSGQDVPWWGRPDTLFKVNSSGVVVWYRELPLPATRLYFTGRQMYYLCQPDVDHDSVMCYDTTGAVRWSYSYVSGGPDYGRGAIDKSGNLYILQAGVVLKIDTNGVLRASATLPSWPTITGDQGVMDYYGPYIDNSGNVLVLADGMIATEKYSNSGSSQIEDDYYLYVTRLSGTTLQPLSQRKPWVAVIKKDVRHMEKDNGKGTYQEIWTGGEDAYTPVGMVNGNLVCYQQYQITSSKTTPTKETDQDLTEWRILIINSKLKGKIFKYKGKGIDKCEGSTGDWEFNTLFSVVAGNGDTLYVDGSIAMGRATCGEPELQQYPVLMQFNVAKKKPTWVRSSMDQPNEWMLVSPGRLFVYIGSNSLAVYDGVGNSMGVIGFSDNLEWYGQCTGEVNKEEGYLYLNMEGSGGPYFAKYALPSLQVAPNARNNFVELPSEFTLHQNYPNPFNPTTTIRFELPAQSRVTLKVFNMLGQEVATVLDNEDMDEGEQEVEFSAAGLASGVYFYRLDVQTFTADENGDAVPDQRFVSVKKMMVMK